MAYLVHAMSYENPRPKIGNNNLSNCSNLGIIVMVVKLHDYLLILEAAFLD